MPSCWSGYGTWQNRYGGDPSIVGRSVRVQGRVRIIVGVLPRDLQATPFLPNIWVPITRTAELETERDKRYYSIVGRLAPEATGAQAVAELEQISARLADSHPDTNEDISTVVRTFRGRYGDSGNSAIAFIMMGAVGVLLLIACANVANPSDLPHSPPRTRGRGSYGARREPVARDPTAAG